ncbi:hypothetical protein [Burkholderia ubonensis]|uniref:hypothetical protein n=1 Tax=Burkholderia ubonensis TaxID=101571 RepID=UPI0012F70929|nr:hypothetical protein [Burkholderia ubonensis]
MLPMLSFHAFGAAVFLTVSPQWIAASASGLPGWRTQDASATLAFRRPIGREFSRQFSYKQNPESGVRVDEKRSAHQRPVHTPCIAPASQRTESVLRSISTWLSRLFPATSLPGGLPGGVTGKRA